MRISMKDILSISGKNILGVNPHVEDFAFFDLWSKPMGLLYLLERMRQNGCSVRLLDMIHEGACGTKTFGRENITRTEIAKPAPYRGIKRRYHRFGLNDAAVRERLAETARPDVIFLTSGMTYWYGGVRHTVSLLREAFPGTPIALGGIYARLCPAHAETLGADFVASDPWLPDVVHPAMDLYGRPPYGVTMTSFGCPLSCRYCASSVLWPDYRRRAPLEVLDEIDFQINLGVKDIAFYDDALLLGAPDSFYPICEEIRRRYGGRVNLHTPNGLHVKQIDERCAATLKSTGFKTIRLSLESIEPEVLRASSGKLTRGDYAAAVARLMRAGYSGDDCETYILAGLPGQSAASVEETIDFVHACGAKPKLAEFSPIPETPCFYEALKDIPALAREPLLQNNSVYSSWLSRSLPPNEMQMLKDRANGYRRAGKK